MIAKAGGDCFVVPPRNDSVASLCFVSLAMTARNDSVERKVKNEWGDNIFCLILTEDKSSTNGVECKNGLRGMLQCKGEGFTDTRY